MAKNSATCSGCGATPGEIHRKNCPQHPHNQVPKVFPTVAGWCGAHGKQDCPLCAEAPNYEDDPEFWDQVLDG